MDVLVISTGATALQTADNATGAMQLTVSVESLMLELQPQLPGWRWRCVPLDVRSGAECSWDTLLRIRDVVAAGAPAHANGAVLLTGTCRAGCPSRDAPVALLWHVACHLHWRLP